MKIAYRKQKIYFLKEKYILISNIRPEIGNYVRKNKEDKTSEKNKPHMETYVKEDLYFHARK